MSVNSIAQSKCYSSEKKAKIAKRLQQYKQLEDKNKDLKLEIFQFEIQVASKELKNNALKHALEKSEEKSKGKDNQISILEIINKNKDEQIKIAKRKKIPTFLKGVGVGGAIVIILKLVLIK